MRAKGGRDGSRYVQASRHLVVWSCGELEHIGSKHLDMHVWKHRDTRLEVLPDGYLGLFLHREYPAPRYLNLYIRPSVSFLFRWMKGSIRRG